jgi:hypothetical protein
MRKGLALLSPLQSADIVLPATNGREIRLRRTTEPTTEQKALSSSLDSSFRSASNLLTNVVQTRRLCSADSAAA